MTEVLAQHAGVQQLALTQPEVDLQSPGSESRGSGNRERYAHLTEHANRRARATDKHPSLRLGDPLERLVPRARDILRELAKLEFGDLGHVLERVARKVVHARARVAQEVHTRVEQDAVERVSERRDWDVAERRRVRREGRRRGRELVLVGRQVALRDRLERVRLASESGVVRIRIC